jgi:hypothetical protein
MGKTSVKAPGPSPEELAVQREQLELLRSQRDILSRQLREQQLIAPILFQQAGVTPKFNEQGEIIGFDEDPTMRQIREGLQGRTLAALKGELPVDPILERELGTQEQTLRESLRRQLGTGFETSTPGIEALQKFREGRFGILEASRRGELSLGESLGLARQQGQQEALMRALQPNFAISQAFGGAAQGFGQALQPFQFGRQAQLQARMATGQLSQQQLASILGIVSGGAQGFGTGLGMAVGTSSARVKKQITPLDRDESRAALRKLRDTPLFRYRYRWEGRRREPHIGPVLELSPKEIDEGDGLHVNLLDYTGLVHAGLKGLDKEVKTLREQLARRRRH